MNRSTVSNTLKASIVCLLGLMPAQAVSAEIATPLHERVARALDALDADTTLYARHLPTGREVAIRADKPVNTLSIIKIPIMVLAFRDAAAGQLDLDARYRVRAEDMRRGSGLIQTFSPGLKPTWRDLVTQMIVTSDNTATDIVIARLGIGRVNTMLQSLGYEQTRLQHTTGDLFRKVWVLVDPANAGLPHREVFERGFPESPDMHERYFEFEGSSTDWLGRTTAREMAGLLVQIQQAEVASPEHSDEMLGILAQQFYDSRLPRHIKLRAAVAHKTGDWPPIAGNDAGIVTGAGGPIVIAVFATQNRGSFYDLEDTEGRIAEMLLEAWQ